MPLPRVVARLNKRFTNRLLEPLARRASGFAVIHHTGRRSGASYATPINLFVLDDAFIASLTYGPSADWVQNVLAGGGVIERSGSRRPIESARLIDRSEAWPALPRTVRVVLRLLGVREFLRLA